jgi:hypothetical protein
MFILCDTSIDLLVHHYYQVFIKLEQVPGIWLLSLSVMHYIDSSQSFEEGITLQFRILSSVIGLKKGWE